MHPERQKPKYSLQLTFKRSLFPAISSLLKGINKMMDLTKFKNAMKVVFLEEPQNSTLCPNSPQECQAWGHWFKESRATNMLLINLTA